MNFLHHYETVSGQLINQSKSNFYTIVQSITGFQPRQFPFTYLGCPVYVRGVRIRIRHFDDIIRKIRGRISGWANRLLSFGGKLVLIRHVLSSILLHLFHVLRLPATVTQKLERLFTKFLWSDMDSQRHIHWCKWPSVCFPVAEGGLRVCSFSSLANAFEMKTKHPSMVQFRYPASPLWRRLYSTRCTAEPRIRWLIRSDILRWAISRDGNFSLRSRVFTWFLGVFVIGMLRLSDTYFWIAQWFNSHWRRCCRSSKHIRVILPCFILWHVWKARNTFMYDSVAFNVNVVIFKVLLDIRLVNDAFGFKTSQLRGILDTQIGEGLKIIMPSCRPPHLVSWKKPPPGVVNLSVDGCSRGNPSLAATGGVFRDHQGVISAAFGSFLGHQSILFAELMALLEGLDLAAQLGFSDLEVESDSATIVSWAISSSLVRWDFTYILGRVRALASRSSISIRHVFREATSAADFMANWACSHQTCR
ncbi:hypothetical protein KPL70_014934 [Citrus sinensis]|nr:hypothetical protein KPL70_014934 [Citrus sinensis]